MQQFRVYTEQPLNPGETIQLEAGPSRHLLQVLRLKAGDAVTLFNGDGHDYSSQLEASTRKCAVVRIIDRGEAEPPTALSLTLAIGISKGDRMEYAIQKAVELGVDCIVPLTTQHCVVRLPAERQAKKVEHWQQVIIAACEQSGRRRIPACQPIASFENWLSECNEEGLLLDPRANATLPQLSAPQSGRLTLLVGPEGGLSEQECAAALEKGFRGTRLGPRILRTETAPLAALAAIQTLWGDYR